jgi:hypothetical protein
LVIVPHPESWVSHIPELSKPFFLLSLASLNGGFELRGSGPCMLGVGSSLFPWANVGGHLAVATAFSLPPRVSTALPAPPLLSLWPCLYVTPALSSSTAGEGWEGAFGPRSPKPEHVSAIGAGRGLGQVEADLFTFVFSLLYI